MLSSEWKDMMPTSVQKWSRFSQILTQDPPPKVGQTPKETIWFKNKTKLYHYQPQQPKTYKTPILMIYALINKPYILDLAPGSSLIEYLTNQGHDVYLLDWGVFEKEDKDLSFGDFIYDYIARAVKKVLRHSQSKEINLLGYCMGGTLTAMFASLHPHLPIKNLVFLTTPIDFSNLGLYSNWLQEKTFDVDRLVDTYGLIPAEMIDFGNKMLKPIANFAGSYVSLLERVDQDSFVQSWKLMQHWVADGTPFPGESYRQWIRDFYQHNKLVKGEVMIRGKKVNLGNIACPVLNIAAQYDHIAQPKQVRSLMDFISHHDKTYLEIPSGHVSIAVGSKASKVTYPTIHEWLKERD